MALPANAVSALSLVQIAARVVALANQASARAAVLNTLAMSVLSSAITAAPSVEKAAIASTALLLPVHAAFAVASVSSRFLMLSVAAQSFQPARPDAVPSSVSSWAPLMLPPSRAAAMRWAVIIPMFDSFKI